MVSGVKGQGLNTYNISQLLIVIVIVIIVIEYYNTKWIDTTRKKKRMISMSTVLKAYQNVQLAAKKKYIICI